LSSLLNLYSLPEWIEGGKLVSLLLFSLVKVLEKEEIGKEKEFNHSSFVL